MRLGGGSKTLLTWTAVAGASYVVHYGTGGATTTPVASGTTTYTIINGSGATWVVATATYSGQPWTSPDTPHFNYNKGTCA